MYDFRRCKLCGKYSAAVKYRLKQMSLYGCADCDFHYIDALDEYPAGEPDKTLLTDAARNFIKGKLPQNSRQLQTDLRFVKTYLNLAGARCLDVGCGAGVFLALLKTETAEPQGIEPQQIFREFAQEEFQFSVREELIDDPYWQEGFADSFDLVTIWDTLEHMNFPRETLAAAYRVIKPGGYLFLDTPTRESFFYRSSEWSYQLSKGTKPLLLNNLYSPKPYRHKQIFTKAQLWNLLESSGFAILGQSPFHSARKKLVVACQKTAT